MIYDIQIRFPGEEPKDAELLIPQSTLRRMVESVTKAHVVCPNCNGTGSAAWEQCDECGGSGKANQGHVDDRLAKARQAHRQFEIESKTASQKILLTPLERREHDAYESAIRERDEKQAQSMTVDEVKEWYEEWNYASGYSSSFVFFVTKKIKERNEKARKDGE